MNLTRIGNRIKGVWVRLTGGPRYLVLPEPKQLCSRCLDELLLPFEKVSGLCVDCSQPSVFRRTAPRPLGQHGATR